MVEPVEAGGIAAQDFAAPGGAVAAQAHAVQRQADDAAAAALFGQHAGDVGVVMLHADGRHAELGGQLSGHLGRRKVGVQVVRHRGDRAAGAGHERADRFGQRDGRPRRPQVAMQRRPDGALAFDQAGRIL